MHACISKVNANRIPVKYLVVNTGCWWGQGYWARNWEEFRPSSGQTRGQHPRRSCTICETEGVPLPGAPSPVENTQCRAVSCVYSSTALLHARCNTSILQGKYRCRILRSYQWGLELQQNSNQRNHFACPCLSSGWTPSHPLRVRWNPPSAVEAPQSHWGGALPTSWAAGRSSFLWWWRCLVFGG